MIETDNLIIRQSKWEDLEDFYRWERLPEVTEFFSIGDDQTQEEVTRKYIEDEKDPKALQFTILLKDGEGLPRIGRIVLADIERGWKAEIWRIYIADKSLRGKATAGKPCWALCHTVSTACRFKDCILIITRATPLQSCICPSDSDMKGSFGKTAVKTGSSTMYT